MLAYGNANVTGNNHPTSMLINVIKQDANGAMIGTAIAGQEIVLKGVSALIVHEELPWIRILLWVVLIVGVLVIAIMVFRLIKQMRGHA